jgi:serine/threonine protein kinase
MPSVAIGTPFIGPKNETFKTADFLGHGVFSEVYRAIGQISGTIVAVNLLPIGVLASTDSKVALLDEERASQEEKHPNVVQVLSVSFPLDLPR